MRSPYVAYLALALTTAIASGCTYLEDPRATAVAHVKALADGPAGQSPSDKVLVFLGAKPRADGRGRVDPQLNQRSQAALADASWLEGCKQIGDVKATSIEESADKATVSLELLNGEGDAVTLPEVSLVKRSMRWYVTGMKTSVPLKVVHRERGLATGSITELRTTTGTPLITGTLRAGMLKSQGLLPETDIEPGPLVKDPKSGQDVPAYFVSTQQVSVCAMSSEQLEKASQEAERQKAAFLAEAKAAEQFYLEKLALKKELEATAVAMEAEKQALVTGVSSSSTAMPAGSAAANLMAGAKSELERARANLNRMRTTGPQEVLDLMKRYYAAVFTGDLATASAQWEGAGRSASKDFEAHGTCRKSFTPGFSRYSTTTPMFVPDPDPMQVGHLLVKLSATTNCWGSGNVDIAFSADFKFSLTEDGKWRRL